MLKPIRWHAKADSVAQEWLASSAWRPLFKVKLAYIYPSEGPIAKRKEPKEK